MRRSDVWQFPRSSRPAHSPSRQGVMVKLRHPSDRGLVWEVPHGLVGRCPEESATVSGEDREPASARPVDCQHM